MRVWGEVTFEDKPIELGIIEFLPTDGTPGPSTGGEIKEGKYDVPAKVGPLPGKSYLVSITAMAKTGKTAPNPLDPKGPPTPILKNIIPAVSNTKTTLKIAISPKAAENKHDFHLK